MYAILSPTNIFGTISAEVGEGFKEYPRWVQNYTIFPMSLRRNGLLPAKAIFYVDPLPSPLRIFTRVAMRKAGGQKKVLKKCPQTHLICLKIVDFPDSAAPKRRIL